MVKKIIKFSAFVGGFVWLFSLFEKALNNRNVLIERYKVYYNLMCQWLDNQNGHVSIAEYLLEKKIRRIAIYGKGSLGMRFYKELKDCEVEVVCFVEKNAAEESFYEQIPVVTMESDYLHKVDCIVITPVFDYESIAKDLSEHGVRKNIISLEEIIYKYECIL